MPSLRLPDKAVPRPHQKLPFMTRVLHMLFPLLDMLFTNHLFVGFPDRQVTWLLPLLCSHSILHILNYSSSISLSPLETMSSPRAEKSSVAHGDLFIGIPTKADQTDPSDCSLISKQITCLALSCSALQGDYTVGKVVIRNGFLPQMHLQVNPGPNFIKTQSLTDQSSNSTSQNK